MEGSTKSMIARGLANPMRAVVVVALMLTALAASLVTIMAAPTTGTPSVTTLGNQERQDISAPNQWVEGNIDFWLESHLYDTEVRIDAGSSAGTVPNQMDVAMSFFFTEKNAIVIDWTQDWFVTLRENVMYYTKSSVPSSGGLYQCSTPPNIVEIPVNGRSIMVPQGGSICISDVTTNSNPDPNLGWTGLSGLSSLNSVLPKRNEPCTTIVNALCNSGTETESSPAKEHYFRVNFAALFGPGGTYPQSWWPNLPAGQSLALYFRNHLAMTAVWKTSIGASGGGSQPEFCITTGPGMIRNTNYNRCSWTTVSREGAGGAQGSKNHGDLFAPGIGQKTIPLPQVVAPTGFITVCKIVTTVQTDRFGTSGVYTNGWTVHLTGPFGTAMTKTTGSDGLGCSRFGPLFPGTYSASEDVKSGFVNIGTFIIPAGSRASGTNPDQSNPIDVILTFNQASINTGPTVTFVNFPPILGLAVDCDITIRDINQNVVSRTFAIAGDSVTLTYTVTNTGNVDLHVIMTHTNTVRFGPSLLFDGNLAPLASDVEARTTAITKTDGGATISDTVSASGTDVYGDTVTADSHTCSFVVRAPSISFTKHPIAEDNAVTVPGAKVTYTITVTNSGDADATITVSDALGSGQTLLNGGADTGAGDLPSPAPTSPAGGADYPAPTTISWAGIALATGETKTFTFRVKVTATIDGFVLTGLMTVTAANANGVDYTPSPNTAANRVTVHRPILKLSQFGYTNTPTGQPTQGVVSGVTVYTVKFTNFGSTDASLSGSLTVTVSDLGSGSAGCTGYTGPTGTSLADCVLSFSGIPVASGDTVTFTLTLEYTNLPTGSVVTAALLATYVPAGSDHTFIPSGVPATIMFTIQGG